MTFIVSDKEIEQIVGVERGRYTHYGRAISEEEAVYILHSHGCKDSGRDLRKCRFSRALDRGIDPPDWDGYEDQAVVLSVRQGHLIPNMSERIFWG